MRRKACKAAPLKRRNLPLMMLQAREQVIARFRPALNANGITEQQWRIVRLLLDTGPLEPHQIGGADQRHQTPDKHRDHGIEKRHQQPGGEQCGDQPARLAHEVPVEVQQRAASFERRRWPVRRNGGRAENGFERPEHTLMGGASGGARQPRDAAMWRG